MIQTGDLEVIKFLHENNINGCTNFVFGCAACRGHIDIAEYILTEYDIVYELGTVSFVSELDHLEMLKWLYENQNKFKPHNRSFSVFEISYAIENVKRVLPKRHSEILDFLQSIPARPDW